MKQPKYRAKKTEFKGIMYDSKKEASRAKTLDYFQEIKLISGLQRQVKFNWIETHQIGKDFKEEPISFKRSYIADFVYFDHENKIEIVEDVKGFITAEYKKKKKIVEKLFNIKINEI